MASGEARQEGRRRLRDLQVQQQRVLAVYERAEAAVDAAERERELVVARAEEQVATAQARRRLALAALGESMGNPDRAAQVTAVEERDVRAAQRSVAREDINQLIGSLSTSDNGRARGRPRRPASKAPRAAADAGVAGARARRTPVRAARAEAAGGPEPVGPV